MSGELRVLGAVEVVDDGRSVAMPEKCARLLAALAVAAGRTCSVEELVDAVWDERPPASARKLLQVYVSQLRKLLPAPLTIATRGGGYALDAPDDALDARRFEQLADQATAAGRAGEHVVAASLGRRALALWRGNAFGDLAAEPFVRGEARRLDELRLLTTEARLEAELGAGRQDEVVAGLLALARAHPHRERLQEQAMTALYRCGRQADALSLYASVRERLHDELGLEPGPALRELQRRILQQHASLDAAEATEPPMAVLPAPLASLVGREQELGQLQALIGRRDARLVVLTGAGGSGKTQLALEAARRAAPSFANGAALVELQALHDVNHVLPAIAHALGVVETGDDLRETVAAFLRGRELLLVLDNAEHLREAAPLFVDLVARAPRVVMLVTSRVVLHVSGEHVFPVAPLAEESAVELFELRARARDPSFERTPSNEDDIREICRRIDGLPLAVELAAAWVGSLTPEAVRVRLDERLELLTGGPRDLPARQQTLRATLEWSVGLLSPSERSGLARLAAFAGSWSLEAAETVCGVGLDVLSALVDHNLVRRVADGGPPRFDMLETVRELAEELLDASGERRALERAHASFFVEFAEEAEAGLAGPDQREWLARLEAEHDECRLALARLAAAAEARDELRLAAALGRFRYVRGYLLEGRMAIGAALEHGRGEASELRAKAYRVSSALDVLIGDYEGALHAAETGLTLYREAGDQTGVARSLSNIGAILVAFGRREDAAAVLDEAVSLARANGDERPLALALNNRADVALTLGDWDGACSGFAECLELLRAQGDEANVARALFNLGVAVLERGEDGTARGHVLDSLERCVALDDKEDIAWCLVALAALDERSGDAERAGMLLGAAERLLAGMGAAMKPYEHGLHERTVTSLRERLGDVALETLLDEGRRLPLADLVARVQAPPGADAGNADGTT